MIKTYTDKSYCLLPCYSNLVMALRKNKRVRHYSYKFNKNAANNFVYRTKFNKNLTMSLVRYYPGSVDVSKFSDNTTERERSRNIMIL
jgi:hypothetical protein